MKGLMVNVLRAVDFPDCTLNPGMDRGLFEPTQEKRAGAVWFFSQNHATAYNGYHTEARFRVWKLKEVC
jgi:hypothetical protein